MRDAGMGPENAVGEWRADERVSRGQASERAVCVCEVVSEEMGVRRPPLPTAVVCPPGRRRRLRLAITASSLLRTSRTHNDLTQSTEEGGGLDGGASGVIATREGGLKPAAMGLGGAGRGGGQSPTARKQKSRAEQCARSSAVAAGAAGGLAGQVAVASPADVVTDVVASPAEEMGAETPSMQ